jgi:hypothetical protein
MLVFIEIRRGPEQVEVSLSRTNTSKYQPDDGDKQYETRLEESMLHKITQNTGTGTEAHCQRNHDE